MTPRPSARKAKALPPPPPRTIYVEMRWQDGWWGWTDVYLDKPRPLAAKWEKIGYRIVEYRPSSPRRARRK